MATTAKKVERTPLKKTPDATALLRADHKEVNDWFEEYETVKSSVKKKLLVAKICTALTVHAQIEEEIFYPAFKLAVKDKELIPEAEVEHATLKTLIAQIQDAEPDDELYDAKVKVLSEYVKHHVKEEQSQIFPKAKESAKLDLADLGVKLLERKEELLAALNA
jgi:hemerythrin superfamily protein